MSLPLSIPPLSSLTSQAITPQGMDHQATARCIGDRLASSPTRDAEERQKSATAFVSQVFGNLFDGFFPKLDTSNTLSMTGDGEDGDEEEEKDQEAHPLFAGVHRSILGDLLVAGGAGRQLITPLTQQMKDIDERTENTHRWR